jgi:hypothetical protein
MDYYKRLLEFTQSMEDDFSKFFDKGNKAAGTRLRKQMQDLKNLAQEIRVHIQSQKNQD